MNLIFPHISSKNALLAFVLTYSSVVEVGYSVAEDDGMTSVKKIFELLKIPTSREEALLKVLTPNSTAEKDRDQMTQTTMGDKSAQDLILEKKDLDNAIDFVGRMTSDTTLSIATMEKMRNKLNDEVAQRDREGIPDDETPDHFIRRKADARAKTLAMQKAIDDEAKRIELLRNEHAAKYKAGEKAVNDMYQDALRHIPNVPGPATRVDLSDPTNKPIPASNQQSVSSTPATVIQHPQLDRASDENSNPQLPTSPSGFVTPIDQGPGPVLNSRN